MSQTQLTKLPQTSRWETIISALNRAIERLFTRKWESYLYAIFPHPTEPRVWMRSNQEDWCLPHAYLPQEISFADVEEVEEAIEKQLGTSARILYYASYIVDRSKRQIFSLYILEKNSSFEELKGGSWIDLNTLKSFSPILPEHQSAIAQYLTEIQSGNIPELRPPWARADWFESAVQWINQQLLELNYPQIHSVQCIKKWGISCVLRVNTEAGIVYFKEASTLPLFCNEPVITNELSKLFPAQIPTVLSFDPQRHWMLLADFGQPIGRQSPVKVQKDVYRLLAQIQIKSVLQIDHLLHLGCLDRRLDRLQTQIDDLFNDENVLSQLKTAEIGKLHALAPSLKRLCLQLSNYNIPQTLVHGDLHLGNVAFHKDSYLFFDWTDSCISHPFFDLFQLFFYPKVQIFSATIPKLRDEYLSQWTLYEPLERLREAWAFAKPLCALHHAITYQHIVACLEPRSQQECNALPKFLRSLLKSPIPNFPN